MTRELLETDKGALLAKARQIKGETRLAPLIAAVEAAQNMTQARAAERNAARRQAAREETKATLSAMRSAGEALDLASGAEDEAFSALEAMVLIIDAERQALRGQAEEALKRLEGEQEAECVRGRRHVLRGLLLILSGAEILHYSSLNSDPRRPGEVSRKLRGLLTTVETELNSRNSAGLISGLSDVDLAGALSDVEAICGPYVKLRDRRMAIFKEKMKIGEELSR